MEKRHKLYFALSLTILAITTGCENSNNVDYTGQDGVLFDIDGNSYKTIGIGSQIWMAENLKTTSFNNGEKIPNVKDNENWGLIKTAAYCYFNNDSIDNRNIYGSLYNFYAVESNSICPIGWHIPSKSEWSILETYLGGSKVAGGKLKDGPDSNWIDDNYYYLNTYGFMAKPGGARKYYLNMFLDKGINGYWWTSTSIRDIQSYIKLISNSSYNIYTHSGYKNDGYSIRCVKD